VAGEAVALGFLLLPDARSHLPVFLLLFLGGAFVSLLAAQSLSVTGPGFPLACGALFRATLLLRAPALSEDVYRYLWDGRVAREGISPYRYAPDDPALTHLSSNLRARVAHREFRTVYPPAAQAVFRVFGGGGNLPLLKAFFAAADLTIVLLLFYGAGQSGPFAAVLYAFHPLPVFEVAGEGHLDALGAVLLLSCVIFLRRGRRFSAGLAFALSFLMKYVSLAAAIPIFRRGRVLCLAGFLVLSSAIWLAARRGGAGPSGDFKEFATRWDFNSVLYPAAERLMRITQLPERAKEVFIDWKERHHDPPWSQRVFPYFYPAFFARLLLAALLSATLLVIGWRTLDLEGGVLASLGALLIFSPTLHPWYLLWVLPFAVWKRNAAFLYLSLAVPLAYLLLYPVPGVTPGMVLAAEYVPFGLLLLASLARSRLTAAGIA
jgi:hypothetical protein